MTNNLQEQASAALRLQRDIIAKLAGLLSDVLQVLAHPLFTLNLELTDRTGEWAKEKDGLLNEVVTAQRALMTLSVDLNATLAREQQILGFLSEMASDLEHKDQVHGPALAEKLRALCRRG